MIYVISSLDFIKIWPYRTVFINGLFNTLVLTFLSLITGAVIGTIITFLKISSVSILKNIAKFYISIFRGTPLLVQIFLIYFGAKQVIGFNIDAFPAALISLSLNSSAYISEILRGGIQSVPIGQNEAARSLGLHRYQTFFLITIPQGLRSAIPALANESITLLKDTSLVSTVGMLDLMRAGMTAQGETYLAFEPFLTVALIYYLLVLILSNISNKLERTLNK